jgi:hypothetical protein
MQEMLHPATYLKGEGSKKACVVADGRFSGGTSLLGRAWLIRSGAEVGTIALVRDGHSIVIDIPNRSIRLAVSDQDIERRRAAMCRPRFRLLLPAPPAPRVGPWRGPALPVGRQTIATAIRPSRAPNGCGLRNRGLGFANRRPSARAPTYRSGLSWRLSRCQNDVKPREDDILMVCDLHDQLGAI